MVTFSKRDVLFAPCAAAFGLSVASRARGASDREVVQDHRLDVAPGRFEPTAESLKAYRTPEWFRDAKLGIWSHWGPQSVARQGDWYARFMYVPGHHHYDHHVKTYGHPSEFGYKDVIPLWKAEKFDPEALMDKYAAAGAKYFVSMGVHHDNFDLWNSRHHRWNASLLGPKRDIVGAWKAAAKRRGLRFGVSEHLGASYSWWHPSHLYDQFWPRLGKRYDGADPRYADLYHDNQDEPYLNTPASWYTRNAKFHAHWFERIRDLIDTHQPDLLYSDGGLPFGEVGRSLLAHLYNSNMARNGGLEAVYASKDWGSGEFHKEWGVQDVERGVLKDINPLPWQTDTSNGDWFFSDRDTYKTPAEVITMFADIVSKNGNMLLNIVQYPDGSLPPESEQLLAELALWMKVNSEAIHGTRPWKVHGEGPTPVAASMFAEKFSYTARDIRFTTRGETLYAIALGQPSGTTAISSLAAGNSFEPRRVRRVRLLGRRTPLGFRQTSSALILEVPDTLPTRHASVFKIDFE